MKNEVKKIAPQNFDQVKKSFETKMKEKEKNVGLLKDTSTKKIKTKQKRGEKNNFQTRFFGPLENLTKLFLLECLTFEIRQNSNVGEKNKKEMARKKYKKMYKKIEKFKKYV